MKILVDSTLPQIHDFFGEPPFDLKLWHNIEELNHHLHDSEILICRATLNVNEALLSNSPIKYVATATSGVDHLDLNYLKRRNIEWFDAKGTNASAVADYVIASIAYLRKNQLVTGRKVGIIGFGEVGSRVYKRLSNTGYECCIYDPLKSDHNGNSFQNLEKIYQCDLLTLHTNLHDTLPFPSRHLVNEDFLKKIKPGCILLNTSRGGVVHEKALLNSSNIFKYCTDVFDNEPNISSEVIRFSTLCTPHIAGHSMEAKLQAMAEVRHKLCNALNIPQNKKPPINFPSQTISIPPNQSWEDKILSIYNPEIETHTMKERPLDAQRFTSLRKAHIRHAFHLYDSIELATHEISLLGVS